jgi:hypothetical protein
MFVYLLKLFWHTKILYFSDLCGKFKETECYMIIVEFGALYFEVFAKSFTQTSAKNSSFTHKYFPKTNSEFHENFCEKNESENFRANPSVIGTLASRCPRKSLEKFGLWEDIRMYKCIQYLRKFHVFSDVLLGGEVARPFLNIHKNRLPTNWKNFVNLISSEFRRLKLKVWTEK